jgi:hypothetical protein
MAGVRMPSPTTMHVPTSTIVKMTFLVKEFASKHFLIIAGSEFSLYVWRLYVVSSSSVLCWFGMVLILACRHNREYSAKVPPEEINSQILDCQMCVCVFHR